MLLKYYGINLYVDKYCDYTYRQWASISIELLLFSLCINYLFDFEIQKTYWLVANGITFDLRSEAIFK
jgi:hypothetical protein